MHMPGHKGTTESTLLDITEIEGADELFHPHGIIAESEKNASELFGCPTYYSTEGSSLCIRSMMHLCMLRREGRKQVLAARNAHFAFVTAAALLDLEVTWILPKGSTSLSLPITSDDVENALSSMNEKPVCVYLTSPDYPGHMPDISSIAEVCHKYGVPLAVDNAHGAYLRFLSPSLHPMDQGADLCCDSAHKTLPVLTGGAYLHTKEAFSHVKDSMALFASTSPSWLILQSLDAVNAWLFDHAESIKKTTEKVSAARNELEHFGWCFYGEEPMKITILGKPYGYEGTELAKILRKNLIEPEFSDPDMVVLMVSSETSEEDMKRVKEVLESIPKRDAISDFETCIALPEKVMSIREASMSPFDVLDLENAEGRIAALMSCSCPPAVPVIMPGERIDASHIEMLRYYGYSDCKVVKT